MTIKQVKRRKLRPRGKIWKFVRRKAYLWYLPRRWRRRFRRTRMCGFLRGTLGYPCAQKSRGYHGNRLKRSITGIGTVCQRRRISTSEQPPYEDQRLPDRKLAIGYIPLCIPGTPYLIYSSNMVNLWSQRPPLTNHNEDIGKKKHLPTNNDTFCLYYSIQEDQEIMNKTTIPNAGTYMLLSAVFTASEW